MGSTARRPPPATGSLHLRNSETVKVVFVDTLTGSPFSANVTPGETPHDKPGAAWAPPGRSLGTMCWSSFWLPAPQPRLYTRTEAAGFVRDVLTHPNIEMIPQSRETFLKGLTLYEARCDKSYSFTDCISMNVMRARSIAPAVTTDLHFAEEGFSVLMPNLRDAAVGSYALYFASVFSFNVIPRPGRRERLM